MRITINVYKESNNYAVKQQKRIWLPVYKNVAKIHDPAWIRASIQRNEMCTCMAAVIAVHTRSDVDGTRRLRLSNSSSSSSPCKPRQCTAGVYACRRQTDGRCYRCGNSRHREPCPDKSLVLQTHDCIYIRDNEQNLDNWNTADSTNELIHRPPRPRYNFDVIAGGNIFTYPFLRDARRIFWNWSFLPGSCTTWWCSRTVLPVGTRWIQVASFPLARSHGFLDTWSTKRVLYQIEPEARNEFCTRLRVRENVNSIQQRDRISL